MPKTDASPTLADAVAEKIRSMLSEENYTPGEKLPTEAELMRRFNASRSTVREAVKLLASTNIVTVRQGSGIFLSENPGISDDPLGFSMISDRVALTEDLFQVLIILEPAIAGIAAEKADEKDIRDLEDIVSQIESASGDRALLRELDVRFHSRLAESSHNLVMKNLTPVIESGIRFYTTEFDSSAHGAHFHRTLLNYLKEHASQEAESEMRYHLLFDKHHYLKQAKN